MPYRKLGLLLGFVALVVAVVTSGASASTGTPSIAPQLIQDSQLSALSATVGGASVLPTTRTVAHWWGSTLDPHNGVTYGYNMVGANPNTCSGSDCSVTIDADITPLNVIVGGLSFNGSDVVVPTLDSPQFSLENYGSTPFATAAGA